MKQYLAIGGALAALAWVGVAAAATPHRSLGDPAPSVGVVTVEPAQDLSGTQPELATPARPAVFFIDRPTMARNVRRELGRGDPLFTARPLLLFRAPRR